MATNDALRTMWMVRAGRGGRYADQYLEDGVVAMGWDEMGEIPDDITRDGLATLYDKTYPNVSFGKRVTGISQLSRFRWELRIGDEIITYDSATRIYLMGKITSDVFYRNQEDQSNARKVDWLRHVGRDVMSARARNTLGSTLTLFKVPTDVADELRKKAVPLSEAAPKDIGQAPDAEDVVEDENSLDIVRQQAEQLIEDLLIKLDWQEMQDLVAGILRAMGYKTRVSPPGADKGKDIFASPDGLGLEEPRIFVEVKHRPGTQMGAPEVRGFLGGRSAGDKCLFVSTGSFTKEAAYEAERSSIPLTLVRLPDLRELLLEHYDALDMSTRRLVPLEKLYWPASE